MSLLRPEVRVLPDNYHLDPPKWGIVGPRVDIPSCGGQSSWRSAVSQDWASESEIEV